MSKIEHRTILGAKSNLLAAVLYAQNKAWGELFERDTLRAGSVVIQSGIRPNLIYFPTDGCVSLVTSPLDDEKTGVMTGMLGGDDLVGLPAALSDAVATYKAVVDVGTTAWRCSAQAARRLLDECPKSRAVMMRYTDLALNESWHLTSSATLHSVRERVTAFLLYASDRAGDRNLPFTQPMIASRLGLRRASVTDLLIVMDNEGLVARSHARITILKPAELREQCAVTWPMMEKHRLAFREYLDGLA